MKKYGILSELLRRRKWQNLGQQIHRYQNLQTVSLRRMRRTANGLPIFPIFRPKKVCCICPWFVICMTTALLHIRLQHSKLSILSWIQSVELWRMRKKNVTAELQLHSDQGFQYTSQVYFRLTQSYNITPSRSGKENPYNNAMAENFFSILKTEYIYRHKPKSLAEANTMIDDYIHFYIYERIQTKTGAAPLTLRHSALNYIFLHRGLFVLSAQTRAVQ